MASANTPRRAAATTTMAAAPITSRLRAARSMRSSFSKSDRTLRSAPCSRFRRLSSMSHGTAGAGMTVTVKWIFARPQWARDADGAHGLVHVFRHDGRAVDHARTRRFLERLERAEP